MPPARELLLKYTVTSHQYTWGLRGQDQLGVVTPICNPSAQAEAERRWFQFSLVPSKTLPQKEKKKEQNKTKRYKEKNSINELNQKSS